MLTIAELEGIIARKEYFKDLKNQGIAHGNLAKVPDDYEILLREITELGATLDAIRDILGWDDRN